MLSKDELENVIDQERYKKRIQKLSSETLRILIKDPLKARKYVQKNIDKSVPNNLKDEYIKMMIEAMQEFAKIVLEKRNKSK